MSEKVYVEALVENPTPGVEHDSESVKVTLTIVVILILSSDLTVVGRKL